MGEERRAGGAGGLSGAEIVWVGVAPQLRPPGSAGPRGRPAAPGGVRDLSAGAACGPLSKRSPAPAGYGAQESEQQVWLWRGRAEGPQDHSVNQTPAVAAPLQLPGPRDSGLRAGCFLSSDEWVTAAYPKTRREGRPGRGQGGSGATAHPVTHALFQGGVDWGPQTDFVSIVTSPCCLPCGLGPLRYLV